MKFTPEHEALRQTWKTLIDREINPNVDEWEKEGAFPAHELFKKMGDAGLLGVDKPVEYGGSGLDFSYAMICAESLGLVNGGSIPMATGVQISMATPALARYGSDELRREFLAPSISGDYVACLGVSETGAGSDVASIKTTASRVGGDWVINGGKMWTTNGAQADWMCLLANTGDGQAHKNKSLIVVPMKTKGVQIAKKLDKLGMRASDTVQTFFDEVKVPVRFTIGEPGSGFIYQMQQFQEERLWAGAGTLMGCDRIINATIEYTRERKVFGRPLLDNQVIHFRLAELKSEVEALRSLVYRACEEYLAGTDVTMLASMAKLKAGRLRREVSDACLQYWGGAGYLWDNPVARSYRDGRLGSIGGGADEVMLQIISKLMGTLPRLGNR
jgi:citronellyl-CoA dehydrogenase